jgi:hypothetical protein
MSQIPTIDVAHAFNLDENFWNSISVYYSEQNKNVHSKYETIYLGKRFSKHPSKRFWQPRWKQGTLMYENEKGIKKVL